MRPLAHSPSAGSLCSYVPLIDGSNKSSSSDRVPSGDVRVLQQLFKEQQSLLLMVITTLSNIRTCLIPHGVARLEQWDSTIWGRVPVYTQRLVFRSLSSFFGVDVSPFMNRLSLVRYCITTTGTDVEIAAITIPGTSVSINFSLNGSVPTYTKGLLSGSIQDCNYPILFNEERSFADILSNLKELRKFFLDPNWTDKMGPQGYPIANVIVSEELPPDTPPHFLLLWSLCHEGGPHLIEKVSNRIKDALPESKKKALCDYQLRLDHAFALFKEDWDLLTRFCTHIGFKCPGGGTTLSLLNVVAGVCEASPFVMPKFFIDIRPAVMYSIRVVPSDPKGIDAQIRLLMSLIDFDTDAATLAMEKILSGDIVPEVADLIPRIMAVTKVLLVGVCFYANLLTDILIQCYTSAQDNVRQLKDACGNRYAELLSLVGTILKNVTPETPPNTRTVTAWPNATSAP
jgi:hypothetical protein